MEEAEERSEGENGGGNERVTVSRRGCNRVIRSIRVIAAVRYIRAVFHGYVCNGVTVIKNRYTQGKDPGEREFNAPDVNPLILALR